MDKFDKYELAWCAGFFDGEGSSFSFIENTGKYNIVIAADIGQKDSDQILLIRFQKAIGGYGLIRRAGRKDPNFYKLRLRSFELAQYTMCLMWRWLGPIKKEQYKRAVSFYLSICHKPKFDIITIRNREIYKYGSVWAMHKAKMKAWLASIPDTSEPFVNPFEKR